MAGDDTGFTDRTVWGDVELLPLDPQRISVLSADQGDTGSIQTTYQKSCYRNHPNDGQQDRYNFSRVRV